MILPNSFSGSVAWIALPGTRRPRCRSSCSPFPGVVSWRWPCSAGIRGRWLGWCCSVRVSVRVSDQRCGNAWESPGPGSYRPADFFPYHYKIRSFLQLRFVGNNSFATIHSVSGRRRRGSSSPVFSWIGRCALRRRGCASPCCYCWPGRTVLSIMSEHGSISNSLRRRIRRSAPAKSDTGP